MASVAIIASVSSRYAVLSAVHLQEGGGRGKIKENQKPIEGRDADRSSLGNHHVVYCSLPQPDLGK